MSTQNVHVSFAQQINNSQTMRKALLTRTQFEHDFKTASNISKTAHLKVSHDDATALCNFYNQVIHDGKHIKEFATNPESVAHKMNVKLSASALKNISEASRLATGAGGNPAADTVDLVAVVIIVLVLAFAPDQEAQQHIIVDESGIMKF